MNEKLKDYDSFQNTFVSYLRAKVSLKSNPKTSKRVN